MSLSNLNPTGILPSSPPQPNPPKQPTSLLVGLTCTSNIHLILGTNPLASSRVSQSLASGAHPVVLAPPTAEIHYALQKRIDDGSVKHEAKEYEDSDLFRLGRDEVGGVVDAVFVTSSSSLGEHVSGVCRRNRIPVNVVDAPHLCTLTLLSTHNDGPLQIGVTTNGRGCKLASRIRREIASSLPKNLGASCARLGEVRKRIQQEDLKQMSGLEGDLDDATGQGAAFNKLVTDTDSESELRTRRMRWLSQICEYWPLRRLAAVSDEDVESIFRAYPGLKPKGGDDVGEVKRGRIVLAGSGPGHPDLLTQATHKAIQSADLILADKLVPSGVLDLIPRRTPVSIARKFPGNADKAQEELHESALAAYRQGKNVLRLKQGDPFVYGRGGEEVQYFRENGVLEERLVVLPGITSALSAPLFAGIPATQRDVADQVLICTGTGKKGKPPAPPTYNPTCTVVFLMALHRIKGLVAELTEPLTIESSGEVDNSEAIEREKRRILWPSSTPCAVVERASCPDQRVIRTTLRHVAEAIEEEGSLPPGLLVVGRACEVLSPSEKGRAWKVENGFKGLDVGDLGVADIKAAVEGMVA